MTQDDYTRIRVGEDQVGIRGLRAAIQEIAQSCSDWSDEDVEQALLEKVKDNNYIPDSATADYGKAVLREFRKSLGQSVDEPVCEAMEILVLGPGCSQCDNLERSVKQVLSEMGLGVSVEHVTDLKEIATYGFVRTPALVINGKIVAMGRVPSAKQIKDWLTTAGS
jgi:small redox-active disulfide protein 2